MALLIPGLALFIGAHSIRIVAPVRHDPVSLYAPRPWLHSGWIGVPALLGIGA